jgi:hypothetical protein
VLCRRAAQKMHIKNIAVFFHPMEQIEVVSGKFKMVTKEAKFTGLESKLSFLQVKSTMTLQERIQQVKTRICEDRTQIAHMRLEKLRVQRARVQPYRGVRERAPGHPQRNYGLFDQVPASEGHPADPHQLHQQNPGRVQ